MSIPRILEMGSPGLMAEVTSSLERGEFVVIPTDTVYGIAVRADNPEAVERLFYAKGRRKNKKLAYLLHEPDDIFNFLPTPSNKLMLLAKRFWPGQLTLVAKVDGETFGFRCPAYPFALILSKTADFPIFITSANVSGEREISSVFDAVSAKFAIPPALIVDGGTTQYGKRSTIVLVEGENAKLMRAGCIPASRIPFLNDI